MTHLGNRSTLPDSAVFRATGSTKVLAGRALLRTAWRELTTCLVLLAGIWGWPGRPLVEFPAVSQGTSCVRHGEQLLAMEIRDDKTRECVGWDLLTGREVKRVTLSLDGVAPGGRRATGITSDGRWCAIGSPAAGDRGTRPLRVWSLERGVVWREWQTSGGDLNSAPFAFSDDGNWLAVQVSGDTGEPVVEVWRTGDEVATARVPGCRAPLTLSADGHWLGAVDDQQRPCLIDARRGEIERRFRPRTFPIALLAISRDGRRLAAAANFTPTVEDQRPTEVACYNVASDIEPPVRDLPGAVLIQLWFDEAGHTLIGQDLLGGVSRVWAVTDEGLGVETTALGLPAVTSDGRRIAIVTGDIENLIVTAVIEHPVVSIVDVQTGKPLKRLTPGWPADARVWPIAFSPDDRWLAVQVSLLPSTRGWLVDRAPDPAETIWETWLLDVETGRTQTVLPGIPASFASPEGLFVAPDRILLRRGSPLEPTVVHQVWSTTPRPKFAWSAVVGLLGGCSMLWRLRRGRHSLPAATAATRA